MSKYYPDTARRNPLAESHVIDQQGLLTGDRDRSTRSGGFFMCACCDTDPIPPSSIKHTHSTR